MRPRCAVYFPGGSGGLVAKLYPTLVTPWTVAHLENTQHTWGHTERSRVWGERKREIQRQKGRGEREGDTVTQRQRMSEQAFIEGGNLGFLGLSHYW